MGIDPSLVERAVATLGQTHQMQGDTVELAAQRTGLDTGVLSQIVEQIGGEGSLTEFANAIKDDPASLKGSLETRKQVEKAKGILMKQLGIDEAEAYRTMQKESMNKGMSMKELARAIIIAFKE